MGGGRAPKDPWKNEVKYKNSWEAEGRAGSIVMMEEGASTWDMVGGGFIQLCYNQKPNDCCSSNDNNKSASRWVGTKKKQEALATTY